MNNFDSLRKLIEKELEWYYQNKGDNSVDYLNGAIHGLNRAILLLEKAEAAVFNAKMENR